MVLSRSSIGICDLSYVMWTIVHRSFAHVMVIVVAEAEVVVVVVVVNVTMELYML